MEAKIGIGYGNIIFGMKTDDIISIIGNPNKVITANENGIQYVYNDLKIKLFFDKEEHDRLYSIEVFDTSLLLFSKRIIGMPCDLFIKFMRHNNYVKYEKEDYDYFETIYYDDCNITVTCEFDTITSLEFSPLFAANNDEVLWPRK